MLYADNSYLRSCGTYRSLDSREVYQVMLTVYLILLSIIAIIDRCPDWMCEICIVAAGSAIASSCAAEDFGVSTVLYILVMLQLRFGRKWYD